MTTELRKVECGQRTLEYLLTRKQVKNINLRVKPEGKVYVSANKNVPAEYIDDFIKEKQILIIKALDKYEENREYVLVPKRYVSGEGFDILGKSLRLKVNQGTEETVTTDGSFVFLTVKDEEDQTRKERLMNSWLKEMQITIFDEICQKTYQIFKKYVVIYPIIKVRYMKTRWGSCHPRKGVITLNSKLIEAPRNCIEYVVLHEFAHFIYQDHSKKFYEFVATLMPDWKERKKELDYWFGRCP